MLTVGISTSSSRFGVIIINNKEVLVSSNELAEIKEENFKDIHSIFTLCMSKTEFDINDVKKIIVDNGPGGTSSVRTGVAYANALAYSLNIDVYSISSFELLGLDLWLEYKLPIILTTKSIKGNAFVGLFENGSLKALSYGKTENIVHDFVIDKDEFITTGFYGQLIKELFPKKKVHLSNKIHGNLNTFINVSKSNSKKPKNFPELVIPITENELSNE